jgi:ribosomal protein S12 methylthiotransferase accessory factor
LASGNTTEEALFHGLMELIERDIRSFQSIEDNSVLLQKNTLPIHLQELLDRVEKKGYFLSIRYMENCFGLPYFMATMGHRSDLNPIYVSGGYGCHLSKEIAINRAVTECFQSRLSFIHGGRDDLSDRYEKFKGWSMESQEEYTRKLMDLLLAERSQRVSYEIIPDLAHNAKRLEDALEITKSILKREGFNEIIEVRYTSKESKLQVVRVIVPGLEFFNESTTRIGKRLKEYATKVFT